MENAVLVAAANALNVMLDTMKEEKGTADTHDVKAALKILNETVENCDGDLLKDYAVWASLMDVVLKHTDARYKSARHWIVRLLGKSEFLFKWKDTIFSENILFLFFASKTKGLAYC